MSEEDTGALASAADAARALAKELLEQADTLDLHDLRATEAIEKVRVGSRALADAVYQRGWGDLFLGIDSFDPDDEDDFEWDEEEFEDSDDTGEVYVEEDLEEIELIPTEGMRLSYQARYDFVVTNPDAFVSYVRGRAAEVGSQEVQDEIRDPESAFQLLTFMDGLGSKEYDHVGLGPAGGEESQKAVEKALWDLDPTQRDDTYPY